MRLSVSSHRLALLLTTLALTTAGRSADAVSVATSYTETFDALGSGLPAGWNVWTSSTATDNGSAFTWSTAAIANNAAASASSAFRNLPGASQAWTAALADGTDRALGWRAGNAASTDGSITFTWANTAGWTLTSLSLDLFTPNSAGTAATFALEYQIGSGGTFTALAGKSYTTIPVPSTTPSALTVTTLSLTAADLLPLTDQTGQVTLRLNNTATTGTTWNTVALDNFSYTASAAIPEPAAYAWYGGISALALALLRRRRPPGA